MPTTICVYCGASAGARPIYRDTAQELGRAMAAAGLRLVYGGGGIGLMGVVADAVLDAGGEAIGIIPEHLAGREVAHSHLTELRVVRTMHERKHQMADLADAFLALPGGYGTLDELCEVLGWAQLGLHAKPIVLLNVEGYWEPLLTMLDTAVREGFLRAENRRFAQCANSVPQALQMLGVL